jgi:hypothetical protein
VTFPDLSAFPVSEPSGIGLLSEYQDPRGQLLPAAWLGGDGAA